MTKSFLNTKEWLEFQCKVGHKTWRFDDGAVKANVIQHKIPFGRSYLYVPHGPDINFDMIPGGLRNEISRFLYGLKELAHKEKSIFIKFEPMHDTVMELIYRRRLKKSSKQIQPHKTVVLNLTSSEDNILSNMHKKTRYNINIASKSDLSFLESDDVDAFWELLQKTAKKDKFYTHKKDYYELVMNYFKDGKELKTKLFLVRKEGRNVAGAITLGYKDTVYYIHGAMDRDYKNLMAPYLLHWNIIRWAKKEGYEYYDLYGIDSAKWPGVTRFKLRWGGQVKEYPGSFDLPISEPWYFVYNVARNIVRTR